MTISLLKLHPGHLPAATLRRLLLPLIALLIALAVVALQLALIDRAPAGKPLPRLQVLSEADRQYYRDAFAFEDAKHFSEADAALAQVSDGILKEALLAGRARGSDPKTRDNAFAGALKGFGSGADKSTLHSNLKGHWAAGLASFRRGDMPSAAAHFRALLAADNNLPGADRAACAFWAYRALHAAGDDTTAMQYAKLAANEVPSFYSILARSVTGKEMRTDDGVESLLSVKPILQQDAVRRAIAFKEIGQNARAEAQLRAFFAASDDGDRKRLITLAKLLGLPAAEMRMALTYAHRDEESDAALYPIPSWTPTSGYRVEPALLFAIMRQESGFNPNARSAAGALGVMQLMPRTAHAIAKSQRVAGRSTQPSVSMTLGQSYLESLMDTSFIGDNLVFLTAAYNSGPGTVANWQRSLHYNDDPLLFVESIPYSETREYVLRVIGNYWVYSRLLGDTDSKSVAALAEGQWPRYGSSGEQLASMLSRLGTDRIE